MGTLIFIVVAAVLGGLALRAASNDAFRRFGGAGLAALDEIVTPHAAEHRRIDEHAQDTFKDDDGDDPRRRFKP